MRVTLRLHGTSHLAATVLVVASAVGGVFGCAIGSITWGVAGLIAGLVGSWCLFLVGLASLYRREQRLEQAAQADPRQGERLLIPTANLSQKQTSAGRIFG